MKKVFAVLMTLTLALVLLPTSMAAEEDAHELDLVSGEDEDIMAYGPLYSYAELDDVAWSSGVDAVNTWVHSNWPTIEGANWISTAGEAEAPEVNTWRKFTKDFELPEGACDIEGTISVTADNAEAVYLNGEHIGTYGTVEDEEFEGQHEWETIKEYGLEPQPGINTLAFIVRDYAQSGGDYTTNPTGLIFKAEITYDLATVQWLPPISLEDWTLNENATLPIKFQLLDCAGDIVTENLNPTLTVDFDDGSEPVELRFDEDEYHYIANFRPSESGDHAAVVSLDDIEITSLVFDVEEPGQANGRGKGLNK